MIRAIAGDIIGSIDEYHLEGIRGDSSGLRQTPLNHLILRIALFRRNFINGF
ncbi:MAG: hypothetical protein K9K63_17360 [Desulfotignum sp.]|nr:hypothetical protein [Desulfotignum sp.]MCF8090393.1 hypothetical protein [Desulfotignum sp.]MCF8139076.1 hypothetical protein [Desulfotignum sp.]